MSAEQTLRQRLHAQLDRALVDLDTDGLRFVLCVALVRGMTAEELERVPEAVARIKGAEKDRTSE